MQNNVNAENVLQSLVQNFGDIAVSTCDAGVIKVQVRALGNGDILTLSNLLQWCDVQVKRSGSGLLMLFIPKPDYGVYTKEVLDALETIVGDECIPGESPKLLSKQEEFVALAKPIIKLLNDDYHPHHSVVIDSNHAELLEGQIAYSHNYEDMK